VVRIRALVVEFVTFSEQQPAWDPQWRSFYPGRLAPALCAGGRLFCFRNILA
jgi:hypothetical protein